MGVPCTWAAAQHRVPMSCNATTKTQSRGGETNKEWQYLLQGEGLDAQGMEWQAGQAQNSPPNPASVSPYPAPPLCPSNAYVQATLGVGSVNFAVLVLAVCFSICSTVCHVCFVIPWFLGRRKLMIRQLCWPRGHL